MKLTKSLSLIIAIVTIATVANAQDVNVCRPKAERILTAAQNHAPDGIDEFVGPRLPFL